MKKKREMVRYLSANYLDFKLSTVVSKAEDRTLVMAPDFEAVCAKFWHVVINQKEGNRTS